VEYLRQLDPVVVAIATLLAFLAVLVAVVNWQGKRLIKHDELLALLDVRVANIHKDREATRVRKLQHPLVPPPLPPRAPTIDARDWRDDEQPTEPMNLRDTARYPLGEPPKGDE
jgi:hypothetical protein